MEMNQRFKIPNEDDLNDFLVGKTSKNTDKGTKTAFNLLKTFSEQMKVGIDSVSAIQLDKTLQLFYVGVRKPNGEYYKVNTMNSIRFGLQRHFQNDYDIIKDPEFSLANTCFRNILMKIKMMLH